MKPPRRKILRVARAAFAGLLSLAGAPAPAQPANAVVTIDTRAPSHPFPHFWERMFGSGRAILALRDTWQRDLRDVKAATDLRYVRFHGIFLDEVGVYDEKDGTPAFNFQSVDQIYDAVLAAGARPFVELSFMPRKLARELREAPFWYRPIVSVPKDPAKWDALVTAFTRHLVDRYGLDEVAQWYFEVWNEPNLDSAWPQTVFFDFYDHTARAVKGVSQRLRVGGPATAQAAWIDALIAHATTAKMPLDFISTHVYGDDEAESVLGPGTRLPAYGTACPALRKARDAVRRSARPDLPLFFTETNATWRIWDPVLVGPFIGTWLADTIRHCDGAVDMMSFWVFSDVFEEPGVMPRPFEGGFGLLTIGGIPKPSFAAFRLLHRLGTQRLDNDTDNALVTRRDDGTIVAAVWNKVAPGAPGGTIAIDLIFADAAPGATARVWRVDGTHGDARALYEFLGRPRYPTPAQIAQLRDAALRETPETVPLAGLRLTLPENGLALVEVSTNAIDAGRDEGRSSGTARGQR